jgi:ribosomal protein S14
MCHASAELSNLPFCRRRRIFIQHLTQYIGRPTTKSACPADRAQPCHAACLRALERPGPGFDFSDWAATATALEPGRAQASTKVLAARASTTTRARHRPRVTAANNDGFYRTLGLERDAIRSHRRRRFKVGSSIVHGNLANIVQAINVVASRVARCLQPTRGRNSCARPPAHAPSPRLISYTLHCRVVHEPTADRHAEHHSSA